MTKTQPVWLAVSILFCVIVINWGETPTKPTPVVRNIQAAPPGKKAVGWDFTEQKMKYYQEKRILTDHEIQEAREQQSYLPGYHYTPGRHIGTKEEEVKQYIEDNIDEILEDYGDSN